MPWAEKLPNGTWRACWRDEVARRRSRAGFRNEAEAKRFAGHQETRSRRGDPIASGRCPTWHEWRPIWTGARVVEPSTAAVNENIADRYLEPRWGQRRLNRIARSDVQAWVNELTAGHLAPGSVEKVLRLLSTSLTAAVRDDRIPLASNPCAGVKLPRVAPGHERYLTRGEVDAIAYHLNEPYRLAVLLAAGTGMRWGELAGLHWQRVDLGTGLLDIVETWDPTAGRIKGYPKGHNRRAVPIPPWLATALSETLDREPARPGGCGHEHARGAARCRSRLVVRGPNGAPMNGRNFGRRQFADACADAGIDKVRLHDLRHGYASWLVQDGVPLQEVQRLLGHASIVTTQRYAHLGVSQHERVLHALS